MGDEGLLLFLLDISHVSLKIQNAALIDKESVRGEDAWGIAAVWWVIGGRGRSQGEEQGGMLGWSRPCGGAWGTSVCVCLLGGEGRRKEAKERVSYRV